MSKIVLAFTKLHPLIPIRHVALVHGDQIIESSGFPVRGHPAGVRMRSLYDFMDQHPDMELRYFEHPDPELVWKVCLPHIGKLYDWRWYGGMFFNRDWQDPERWVCHELIAHACWRAGRQIVDVSLPWIRPEHLYAASKGEAGHFNVSPL